jgi:tetratricopeptide (TPR) repeat protein
MTETRAVAVHRSIVAVDVEGFGGAGRTNVHQAAIRAGLYSALEMAFASAGISWADCYHEDRGDGLLILIGPEVAKLTLVEPLPHMLAAALRQHNAVHGKLAQIRIRMALNAGEVLFDDHGVAGSSVNLTFRLLEAAELKSVLASTPGVLAIITSAWFFDEVIRHSPASNPDAYTQVLVSVKETSATAWINVPGHPYPGHQALSSSRPDRAQSGVPERLVPHQIPSPPAHFVGRTAEMQTLTGFMNAAVNGGAAGIFALNGTAGIGKTALALQWAWEVRERFPDGQLYVNLHGFDSRAPSDPGQVLREFLIGLNVSAEVIPAGLDAKAALYRSMLAGRRVLILLDNARDPEQVRPLLPASTGCLTIVTSRSRLDGLAAREGAGRLNVGLISGTEAIALLAQHAGRERLDGEPEAAADLVDQCARLPLALCITAARAAAYPQRPLAMLASELRDERSRLDHLDLGSGDLDVRAIFAWSYRRLPETAAKVFRLLGEHASRAIDSYAVAALASLGLPAARQAIDELLAAHLAEEASPGRVTMHDLLRVYAGECCRAEDTPDERSSALTRLLAFYLSTAERADLIITPYRYRIPLAVGTVPFAGPPLASHADALAWFTAEQENLAGLCRASGHGFDTQCWQLAYTLRGFFFLAKQWDAWQETHELALAAARREGNARAEAITLNNLGLALLERGELDLAAAYYQEALRLFRHVGDHHGESNALANHASVLYYRGEFAESLRENLLALEFYERSGARRNVAITLRSIALVEIELLRLADAIGRLRRALEIFADLGLQLDAAMALNCLGEACLRGAGLGDARQHFSSAVELSRACGSLYEQARAHYGLGQIALATGDRRQACSYWEQALAQYTRLGAAAAQEVSSRLAAIRGQPPSSVTARADFHGPGGAPTAGWPAPRPEAP